MSFCSSTRCENCDWCWVNELLASSEIMSRVRDSLAWVIFLFGSHLDKLDSTTASDRVVPNEIIQHELGTKFQHRWIESCKALFSLQEMQLELQGAKLELMTSL
jgi:hypothetical protein